jgi:beta-galactosidase
MKELRSLGKIISPMLKCQRNYLHVQQLSFGIWKTIGLLTDKTNISMGYMEFSCKYMQIARTFGAPVDVISESTDLSKYKIVIVPAYELVDSVLVKKWNDYVSAGGNLVLTCRTATKDRMGHFWEGECAAPFQNLLVHM